MIIKEGILQSIEDYNNLILKKTDIHPFTETKRKSGRRGRSEVKFDDGLYKSDLKGLFYNYLRRNVFNRDYTFSIDSLYCQFNEDGTLKSFNVKPYFRNFTEANLIQREVDELLNKLPELGRTKFENEMHLIINSIKA